MLNIKKDTATTVLDKHEANGGVFAPSSSSSNKPLFFVIDNTDLSVDTSDKQKQINGTAIALFQQKDTDAKVSTTYLFIFFSESF